MITKITPVSELKQLFLEILLNNTDKVSKVSNGSVVNALGFSVATIGQKAIKDIALLESMVFPSNAYGDYLDIVADIYGVPPRFEASGSSVYLRVIADPGTVYEQDTNTFTGSNGISFTMDLDSVTIPASGFEFIKVRSDSNGSLTNVDPMTISVCNNAPSGHTYVINDFIAVGGRDAEQDDVFRVRIKDGANIAAESTLAKLTQAFMKVNSNVLRTFYYGTDDSGKIRIGVLTQNGVDLTTEEKAVILDECEGIFSLTDMRPYNIGSYGVVLENIDWLWVDMDFRVKILSGYDISAVRKDIQVKLSRYLDYRFWDETKRVEWDDMLHIVKSTLGVGYVPDQTFIPNADVSVPYGRLPRIRGFVMRDEFGAVIFNSGHVANPIYFPNSPDYAYQSTVLKNIAWQ